MPQLSARSVALCRALARSVCGALTLVGVAVLIGWLLDVPSLKNLAPGWAAMKPNTALALLLAAGALWPLATPDGMAHSRWLLFSRIAAGAVAFIGSLTLTQHAFELNFGIDGLLFHSATGADTSWPMRMSPLAAADFILLGGALLMISGKGRPAAVWVAQLAALVAAFGAFIAVTGYLYGPAALGLAHFFTSTALHTAAALLALSVAVACARPTDGLMALFNSTSAGGVVLRRLIVPVALLPVAINWLELECERRGIFPADFAWMLDAALTVLLVGLLVWFVARILHQKDVAREAAELELRRSEERYRQLIEMSPVAIIVKDQRRIEFANSAARTLVGATQADEMLGKSPFAFVHPESRAIFEKDFCRVLRDGTPLPRTEQRVLRLDGTELDIAFSASAVDYHGQRFAQVVAHDITAQKRTEQALRESEKRFRLIAETITEVFWMADVAGDRMVYISPAYERVWGRSCRSLYEHPRSFVEAIHPDDRPLVLASFEVQKQGKPFGHEYRVVQPNGKVRWIWDRGYPVRNDNGAVIHYVGVAQDVTEQRNARQEIVDALDRLNLVAQATNDVLWDWNLVTDELWWGLGKGNTFGYAQNELTGGAISWSSRIHPDDRDRVIRECEALRICGGTHWSGEYRFRRRDGSYAEVLDRYSLIRDAQGKAVRAVGAMMDITERRRSEAQIRFQARLLDQVRNAVIATGPAGRIIYWNSFASELYQWTSAEALGKNLMEVLIPVSEHGRSATIMEEMQSTGSWEGEFTVQRKDGHIFPVHVVDTLLKDRDGKIAGIVGVSFDITERKRADEILRRDASILSQLHDAVICTDLAGIVTYWNDAATHLLGWKAEESIGRSFLERHPSEEHTERWQRFQRILAGDVLQGERQTFRKDGVRIWVSSRISLSHDARGHPVGVISVARDVTERKQFDESLRASENRFRATFEQAAMGMTVAAIDGRFLRVNEKFCAITGFSAEEMLARTFQEITHRDDLALDLQQVQRLVAGEIATYTLEKRYVRKDRSPVWVELTASLVRRSDGSPDYFIALIEDITQRRNLESQLLHAQKMEAIGQLAGGVAHDFNNMLTAIQGHASLLGLATKLAAPARESLDEIMNASERAASLTRQLLLFSRREVMQPSRLDLNLLVTQLTRMLQRLIGEDVRLTLHLHPLSLPIYADSGMIDQVLMNLAVNARDAMPGGGELIIETSAQTVDPDLARIADAEPGQYACLSVSDTGCGIAPEILPRISEPFFTTKESGKGTGLGLATVFGIAKQHRGWVKVNSELNRGTTFRVFVPVTELPPLPDRLVEPTAPPRGHGETILLVEDDDPVREMTAVILERHGYKALVARDGNEAVQRWNEAGGAVDLLFTDLVMPGGMSGIELAAKLQIQPTDLKVLFTSGYSAEIAGRALKLRPNQTFLQKPFAAPQLLTMIAELLHPSKRGD